MSFVSKKQARYMFAKHPKIAEEFASKTNFNKIPESAKSLKQKYEKARGK